MLRYNGVRFVKGEEALSLMKKEGVIRMIWN